MTSMPPAGSVKPVLNRSLFLNSYYLRYIDSRQSTRELVVKLYGRLWLIHSVLEQRNFPCGFNTSFLLASAYFGIFGHHFSTSKALFG